MMMIIINVRNFAKAPKIRKWANTGKHRNKTGQKCDEKGRRKTKIQEFMYRETTNVHHAAYDSTGNNCCTRQSN
jgi:hypothetical protein